jgi:hypothetical protein
MIPEKLPPFRYCKAHAGASTASKNQKSPNEEKVLLRGFVLAPSGIFCSWHTPEG